MTRLSGILKTKPAHWLQAVLFASAMAACAGVGSARAGDEPGVIMKALGMRTSVPAAPDFIVNSRQPAPDFIPVHTPRAKPAGKPMVKEDVAKQEQSLDSARRRQDRLAGRAAAPVGKSVADEMSSKDAKPAVKRPACGLTCPSPGLLPAKPGKEAQ